MTEELKKKKKVIHRKHDFDDVDVAIMLELNRQPPATYREIAEVIGRSHMTVRQRVVWLMETGYAKRADGKSKGDARSIILTSNGRSVIERQNVQSTRPHFGTA